MFITILLKLLKNNSNLCSCAEDGGRFSIFPLKVIIIIFVLQGWPFILSHLPPNQLEPWIHFFVFISYLHTCRVSRFRLESHDFGNEITLSRWLRNFSRISINTFYENKYYGSMNKSVKPLVCVIVMSDLMLATGILIQNNRYPVSM